MSTSTEPGLASLTARQREVLELIARGYTNGQIAEHLGVSLDGAKWHVKEILSKLSVESREDAAAMWAREHGFLTRARRSVRGLVVAVASARTAVAVGLAVVVASAVTVAILFDLAPGEDDAPPATPATGSPTTAAPTSTPVNQLRIAWHADTTEGYTLVAAGDLGVFVAAGPAYDDDEGPRFVESLDPANGTQRWRRDTACAPYQPTVVGELVVFPCNDGVIYALEARTGNERWRADTGGAPFSVVVAGDLLIAGDMDAEYYGLGDFSGLGQFDRIAAGRLYAIDSRTGAERWRRETGMDIAFVSVDGNDVFVAAYDVSGAGMVLALAAATGTERWRQPADGVSSPAAIGTDAIFVSTSAGLVALDRRNGTVRWRVDAAAIFPIIVGGIVVGRDTNVIVGFDARTGAEKWHQEYCDCQYFATSVGSAVVVTGGGIGILDPVTGTTAWSPDAGQGWLASAAHGRRIYAGSQAGHGVLALDLP
ncbi:MAG: PQQ-binding-like beta-propeller repeat protein [Chloroflexi bacterium]|nr:PQQ-binding-like beta-propeller repeat protein [Chloroflexota bacterium]